MLFIECWVVDGCQWLRTDAVLGYVIGTDGCYRVKEEPQITLNAYREITRLSHMHFSHIEIIGLNNTPNLDVYPSNRVQEEP